MNRIVMAMAAVAVFGQPSLSMAATAKWLEPGFNSEHTAYNAAEKTLSTRNVGQLSQKWSFATQGAINVPPIERSGVAFALSQDGNLYAVDSASGKQVWSYPAYSNGTFGPAGVAAYKQLIYTTCQIDSDGGLDGGHFGICALNAKTGVLVWNYAIYTDGGIAVDSLPYNGPVVSKGVLFFGESDTASFAHVGYMVALDAATGAVDWVDGNCEDPQVNDCNLISSAPDAVDTGNVIYETGLANGNNANICDRNATDGTNIWCSDILFDTELALTIKSKKVLFPVSNDGSNTSLTAISESTGKVDWTLSVPGVDHSYFAPAVADGTVYFAAGGVNGRSNLYALSLKSGKQIWSYLGTGAEGSLTSGVSAANGVVYAQCQTGPCAFDAATGATLFAPAGGSGSPAASIVADGMLITVCNANDLCSYTQ
jgi:outer membrane protein assembly factor BamB